MKALTMALLTTFSLTMPVAETRAEELPPIRQVVSFGDSLTDAGTYWVRFTTNPGLTFAQHLAVHYGAVQDFAATAASPPAAPWPDRTRRDPRI